MTLKVTKINESFSLIEGSSQDLVKISDFYKVEREGQYFDPLVKRGFKSPFDFFTKGVDYNGSKALLIMNGLLTLHPVLSEISKDVVQKTNIPKEEIEGLLDSLKSVLPFEPYGYQREQIIDILTGDSKALNRLCTGCLDGESSIEVYTQLTETELRKLL